MSAACLRRATVDDLTRVHRIETASQRYPWTLGVFRDSLEAGYGLWVDEVDGQLAGYYVLMPGVGEAHLLNLAVAPEWRRQGRGRALVSHCLDQARALGAGQVFLEVRVSNAAAIALYETQGFDRIAVRRGYYPAGDQREDAWVMMRTCDA